MATSIHSSTCAQAPISISHHANNRTLWDRMVFVAFCGCLLLFSRALAGLGVVEGHTTLQCPLLHAHRPYNPPGPHHTDIQENGEKMWSFRTHGYMDHARVTTVNGAKDIMAIPGALSIGYLSMKDAAPEEPIPAPTPVPTPAPELSNARSQPQGQSQPVNLHFLHRFYDPHHDPFDLEPFFDADEYDNDGQPFALKIHVKVNDGMTTSGSVGKCQASGGLRCDGLDR